MRNGHSVGIVLGYHEIAPILVGMRPSLMVTPATFAAHLTYLRLIGGRCVSLDDIARALRGEIQLPPRAFALTFDDGYVGVLRYALPILRRFRCTATVFVSSRLVGERGDRGDPGPIAKMDLTQLRSLPSAGVSVGSHTRSHANLTTLRGESLRSEIAGARIDLEDLLDRPVRSFCYPYGCYDAPSVSVVEQAGYTIGCTTEYGVLHPGSNPYATPRVTIGENLSLPRFIFRVGQAYRVVVSQKGAA